MRTHFLAGFQRFLPLISLSLIALAGCHPAPDPNPMELRTYDVPQGSARALNHTLQDAFWSGDASKNQSVGHPSITPDGRLLVLAPANIQANVQTSTASRRIPPIVRAQGPQSFIVGRTVHLASMEQEEAMTQSDDFFLRQRLTHIDDGVFFELDLRYAQEVRLETRVRLVPDRTVVLGANGPAPVDKAAPDTTLYYVVRLAPSAQPKP